MRNRNRVSKKQWRRWSTKAQQVFNDTYAFVLHNPILMNHPAAPPLTPDHWKTLAWNAAWIAADAVDEDLPTDVVTLTRAGKEVARTKVA